MKFLRFTTVICVTILLTGLCLYWLFSQTWSATNWLNYPIYVFGTIVSLIIGSFAGHIVIYLFQAGTWMYKVIQKAYTLTEEANYMEHTTNFNS
ncbi:hypothetical protein GCM10023189_32060 [Nibrella saemangeumensis]|uniref:Uncharacterized protein n=1 Tax=Nibrella saemangeumensis TaxID=1084526 RepID=A0ABP8N2W5_9BACT